VPLGMQRRLGKLAGLGGRRWFDDHIVFFCIGLVVRYSRGYRLPIAIGLDFSYSTDVRVSPSVRLD